MYSVYLYNPISLSGATGFAGAVDVLGISYLDDYTPTTGQQIKIMNISKETPIKWNHNNFLVDGSDEPIIDPDTDLAIFSYKNVPLYIPNTTNDTGTQTIITTTSGQGCATFMYFEAEYLDISGPTWAFVSNVE